MTFDGLTKGERFIVEWQFNRLGGFYTRLAELMITADLDNLEKLGQGFPEEAAAMRLFKNDRNWWPAVCGKAGIGEAL